MVLSANAEDERNVLVMTSEMDASPETYLEASDTTRRQQDRSTI